MKKMLLRTMVVFALLLCSPLLYAETLLQVYYDGLHNDPTFKEAESTWLSQRENLAIARSQYLPSVLVQGTVQGNHWNNQPTRGSINLNGNFTSNNLTITATQPIFDAAAWESIRGATASVKSAAATYSAAAQDLIARVANAYFGVMEAYETLQFTIANKNAVWRQYETAKQKFKVGLIAITGVYNAQSRFDQAVAAEIENQNQLQNRVEDLRAITGIRYFNLKGIRRRLPLIKPKPANPNVWVKKAQSDNYSIKAAEFSLMAARHNIAEQEDGRMPTVDVVGQYQVGHSSGHPNSLPTGQSQSYVGLSLNFPVLQGGLVSAESSQARYNYLTSSNTLEFTERSVVTQIRQAYLGIMSNISKVKADKQSIISAKNAFKATEAGYQVGTRTMVDVLDDLTAVYRTENDYARDQYNYLRNIIALKQAAGTLSVKDIEKISRWLGKTVRMPRTLKTYAQLRREPKKLGGYTFKSFSTPTDMNTQSLPKTHNATKSQKVYFAIQVYSAKNYQDVLNYIKQHKTSHHFYVVQQDDEFKVLYGRYEKISAAYSALKNGEPAALKDHQGKVTTIMPDSKTIPLIKQLPTPQREES